ncbi:MAG: sugar transferase [Bryobacteraceae bacterium]|jgi:lipopolysaccharide/colanic/teichoic acid biosynthesis glycosyltransferase
MRRSVDFLVALTALILLSPLLAVLMLAVLVSSPGNPFYGGRRVGKDGRMFRMWKFRTMINGASKMGPITGKNDSRVTPVGRILRKTKFDELPQFFNLLWGHMTLVGPRPESPDIVALYTPRQRAVLSVKPGVTGKVQLNHDDESEIIPEGVHPVAYYVEHLMEPKLRMDLDYLRGRTFLTDARIVFATAGLVLRAFARR